MMGTGEAEGEHRAVAAAEAAISNPLLDNISMKGARGILINITGGMDMTLFEVDAAANRIREEVDEEANIIFGSTFDENSAGRIRVSVLATGIDSTHTSNPKGRVVRGSESDLGVSDVVGDTARVGVSGYARVGLQE
ncbi:MAG: cell division protein FtsZ, partial [Anaplasma sp.]|nr:cell division protein FtsZ [Anaplasma sp.]